MKKSIIFLILMLCCVFIDYGKVNASKNYTTFQEIELTKGKLLKDYSETDITNFYSNIEKRKFSGWSIYYINQDVECSFISETIFSYYNKGTTAIVYNYSVSSSSVDRFSISGSGNINYSLNGTKSSFKNGLQAALKIDASYQSTDETETKETLKVEVDPNTMVNLYITGSGKITNGVACKYLFWIRGSQGGFEYFVLQTQYPRLEKVAI